MWSCEICTLMNPPTQRRCSACQTRRSVHDNETAARGLHQPPRDSHNDNNNNSNNNSNSGVALLGKEPIITKWIRNRKRKRNQPSPPPPVTVQDIPDDRSTNLIATMNGCDMTVFLQQLSGDDNIETTNVVDNHPAPTMPQCSTTPATDMSNPVVQQVIKDEEVIQDEDAILTHNCVSSATKSMTPHPSTTTTTATTDTTTTNTQQSNEPHIESHFFYTPPLSMTMNTQPSQMDEHDSGASSSPESPPPPMRTLPLNDSTAPPLSLHPSPHWSEMSPSNGETATIKSPADRNTRLDITHDQASPMDATHDVPKRSSKSTEESSHCHPEEWTPVRAWAASNDTTVWTKDTMVPTCRSPTIPMEAWTTETIDSNRTAPITTIRTTSTMPTTHGFQTAGFGTRVHISTEAWQKASRILDTDHVKDNHRDMHPTTVEDRGTVQNSCATFDSTATMMDVTSSLNENAVMVVTRDGFQTAGLGGPIHMTKEAMRNASRILGDCNRNESESCMAKQPCHNQMIPSHVRVSTRSNTKFPSFHTAGCGKVIAVSPTSLQRAAKILDPSTNNTTTMEAILRDRNSNESEPSIQNPVLTSRKQMQSDVPVSTLSNTKLPSFHTAGCGRVIAVSPTSLERAAKVLDPSINNNIAMEAPLNRTPLPNIDHPTTTLTVATTHSGPTKGRPLANFQTAGRGDSIRVSDESRRKAALLFHDSTTDTPGPPEEPSAVTQVAVPVRVAFQTAGRGETISVTLESLEVARSILVDPTVIHLDTTGTHGSGDSRRNVPFDDLTNQPVANRSGHPKNADARIVGGQESISDFGMDENVVGNSTTMKRLIIGAPMAGFQTAGSRTKVQVSDESLQKAALILQNGNVEKGLEPKHEHLLQSSSQNQTTCDAIDQGNNNADAAALLVRPGAIRNCTNNSASISQHTPTAKNSEFELTNGDSNAVTPAIQQSNLYCTSQNNTTDTRTFHDHQAPKSCRRSFSVSSMVKGLMPLYEEQQTESPFPCLEIDKSLRQASESIKERADMQLGMSTPAQQSDEISKYVGKTFVTPGSSAGTPTCFGSPFSFPSLSLREAVANGLMVSSASQSCQFGVNEITVEVSSLNACQLRFNRTTSLPEALSDHLHDFPDLIGSLPDYRNELKRLQCDIMKICDAWLSNHVRWIIWKLASTERKFAFHLAGKYLTFDSVVLQLKFRYDKEIRRGKRPALRRLLNRDISPGCMYILCVARIMPHKPLQLGVDEMEQQTHSRTETGYVLELTDGWYSLPAMPDYQLCDFISRGTIQVGTKLLITNSSMTGFDEGIDPLDDSFDSCSTRKSPVLHISINSSRLARWNSKLGQVSLTCVGANDGMFLTKQISDVYDCGGRIPLIDLRIIQRFPLSYLDRTTSSLGTRSRILTEREEQTRVEMYEKQRQIVIDEISEGIQTECEKDVDDNAPVAWKKMIQDVSSENFDSFDDDAKSEINRWNSQRVGLIQRRMQQEIESKLEELDMEKIKPSKPFLRILVTSGFSNRNASSTEALSDGNEAFVTIWDPSTEQLDLLQTGTTVRMKNLDAKSPRFEGRRQLSGGSSTSMLPLSTFQPPESGKILQQKYTSLFALHLKSKRSLRDHSNDSTKKHSNVSVVGILLDYRKHKCRDDWFVYLTDKSQLLLKIHCVNPCDKLRRVLKNVHAMDNSVIVEFESLVVTAFDSTDQCPTAMYSKDCTFSENTLSSVAKTLHDWSISDHGYASILKLRSYVNVGLQELSNLQTHENDAIGYISGLFVLPSLPELIVKVDCGSPTLNTWRFPIALIQSFMSFCDVDKLRKDIALNDDEEVQLAKLTKIGQIFGSRKNLFHFKLRKAATGTASNAHHAYSTEVLHVSIADTNALATLYSQVIL